MATVILLLPPGLMALLLAAHCYRAGIPALVLLSLALIVLLCVRRPWAARIVQAALWLGSIEWVRALLVLVNARAGLGLPFTRLAVILGLLSIGTALSALMLNHARLRRYFRPARAADPGPGNAVRP